MRMPISFVRHATANASEPYSPTAVSITARTAV
jgi:hypothetical protein